MSTGSLDRLQRNSVKNMHKVLGIDTSNYTTSAALYTGGKIRQEKQLLPVRKGELGRATPFSTTCSNFLRSWNGCSTELAAKVQSKRWGRPRVHATRRTLICPVSQWE